MLLKSKGFKMKKILKERKRECRTIPIDWVVLFNKKEALNISWNKIDHFKYYHFEKKIMKTNCESMYANVFDYTLERVQLDINIKC